MRRYCILLTLLFIACPPIASFKKGGQKYRYEYALLNFGATKMTFSDSIIDIVFSVSNTAIGFKLSNKTDRTITVDWDKISLVLFKEASRVMHSGIRYIERDKAQVPTIIPPYSYIADVLIPADNIWYSRYGGWNTHDLFIIDDHNDSLTRDLILKLKNHQFNLFFPIALKGNLLEYTFFFAIADIRPLSPLQPTMVEEKSEETPSSTPSGGKSPR